MTDGNRVNIINSAKNMTIFVAIGISSANPEAFPTRNIMYATDTMTMMLVSPDGTIIAKNIAITD